MTLGHTVELSAGQVLFREGDPPTVSFLVERGRLRITANRAGQEIVLGVVEPGGLVGEVAVLDDSPRTATATALEPCVLTAIDRTQFAERLAAADPIVRALLLSQFARYRNALATFTGRAATSPPVPLDTQRNAVAAQDKIRLENALRDALENGALEMQLQPIQHIASGRIGGYEALTRWQHPERGPVSPSEFIALAEETSLIVPVGDYVLDAVCLALQRFAATRREHAPYIGVNISGRQIEDPEFVEKVAARIARCAIDPALLKIEITESLMLDYTKVARFVELCHDAGIRVAIDDFGTGYSSLAHLHRLPFDTLKLAQEFVRQIGDPRCLAIVRAVVAMAGAIGCDMIAEGVETPAELAALRQLGCQYAQGYLVGKPQRIDTVLASAA